MTAYGLAHLHDPDPTNLEVIDYIERIQDTLDPFGGRFVVHGATVEVVEGEWPGTIVIIEFPSAEAARAWYASPAYQELLPLRTNNVRGDVIIVEAVPEGYDPRATAAAFRARAAAR
jgi:uncharacterized protein (DUF1330 family)